MVRCLSRGHTPFAGVRPDGRPLGTHIERLGVLNGASRLGVIVVGVLSGFCRQLHEQIWAWHTVLLRGPGAEVCQLTAFRAERPPGIAMPRGRPTAQRAGHFGILTHRRKKGSAVADRVARLCVKQTVQSILVDLRNAEELNSELTMFAPTNRCRLDRNGRSEVSRANEDSDS